MIYLKILSYIFIFSGILYLIISCVMSKNNKNQVKEKDKEHKFAILIPARYESKVIGRLLESIKNQTEKISMEDVYIIVESNKDPTISISNEYGCSIVFRKNISLARKGYALDDAIKYILGIGKEYSAYFIFDADNVLDKDYIKNMTETYDLGYDIGIGYRNCKNGNDSIVSAASALVFSMINTFGNKLKDKKQKNITISGTGFYIRGEFIKKWQAFPFHELTEDYELTLYSVLNDMTTYYNKKAIFYDEQPIKYKDTINQRVRWIKGYFTSRKNYIPKIKEKIRNSKINSKNIGSKIEVCMGVKPYILIVIGLLIYILSNMVYTFIYTFNGKIDKIFIYEILFVFLVVYIVLMIVTIIMLINEKNSIALSKKMKVKVLFYFPIFLITFLPCAIKALFIKDVKWERVEHTRNV